MVNQPIKGSIELLTGDGEQTASDGLTVQAATAALVPLIMSAVHGLTGITATLAPRAGVVAEWTATNDRQQPVTVLFHRGPEDTP